VRVTKLQIKSISYVIAEVHWNSVKNKNIKEKESFSLVLFFHQNEMKQSICKSRIEAEWEDKREREWVYDDIDKAYTHSLKKVQSACEIHIQQKCLLI